MSLTAQSLLQHAQNGQNMKPTRWFKAVNQMKLHHQDDYYFRPVSVHFRHQKL